MPDEEDLVDVLKDVRRWVKILGLQEAKPILQDLLTHEDESRQRDLRIVYHLTNGGNGQHDIADKISFSRSWVKNRHREWSNMGLIERTGPQNQYRHIISLEQAGMDVPEPRENEEEDEEQEMAESEDSEETQEEAELTDYE